MATKQFYATGDFKYGTRMMRAGDPVEMTAPHARLYAALGKISPEKPGAASAPEAPQPKVAPKRRRKAAKKK